MDRRPQRLRCRDAGLRNHRRNGIMSRPAAAREAGRTGRVAARAFIGTRSVQAGTGACQIRGRVSLVMVYRGPAAVEKESYG